MPVRRPNPDRSAAAYIAAAFNSEQVALLIEGLEALPTSLKIRRLAETLSYADRSRQQTIRRAIAAPTTERRTAP